MGGKLLDSWPTSVLASNEEVKILRKTQPAIVGREK